MTITSRTGTIHHLQLTVSNKVIATEFYKRLLVETLGYKIKVHSDEHTVFKNHGLEIILAPSKGKDVHNRFNPGYHHMAFNVDSRDLVDKVHQRVVKLIDEELGKAKEHARILDPPMEYPHYGEGYYAFFFTDMDGLKLEIVYDPSLSD
ncbi:hypothetical protein BGW42_006627 [Actinomortierella wolfii]|nr:hypothetical protein BGW42_006627 [Actinomortierella wolfii]